MLGGYELLTSNMMVNIAKRSAKNTYSLSRAPGIPDGVDQGSDTMVGAPTQLGGRSVARRCAAYAAAYVFAFAVTFGNLVGSLFFSKTAEITVVGLQVGFHVYHL